ncbi:S8 family serine peptidase [Euzebya pacifica]|uniref:S8 family serine peptidase n=1 Tax=Euzebya pacifica TaxID=1608957 RepID=UPI0030FA6AC3
MTRTTTALAWVLLAALVVPGQALAQDRPAADGVEGIIVVLDGSVDGVDEVVASADGDIDVIGRDTLSVAVDDPTRAIDDLTGVDGIDLVEPDWPVRLAALPAPDDPRFGDQWGLANTGQAGGTAGADVDALEAWDLLAAGVVVPDGSAGPLGNDVVVAVSDSGIDASHPDLVDRMWRSSGQLAGCPDGSVGYDWIDDGCAAPSSNGDGEGHGTHVAGIVAATMGNTVGTAGLAPHARLLDLRFLDAAGNGTTSDAIAAINVAIDLVEAGVDLRVFNASWSGNGYSSSLAQAIAEAEAAGILLVAAAGNEGADNDTTPTYPCGYAAANVICVGATDRHDNVSSFSNHSTISVDVGAPGTAIHSTARGGGTTVMNGTSMAAPLVAATGALLAGCGVALADIRTAILGGVEPVAGQADAWATGGRLDLAESVRVAGCDGSRIAAPGAPGPNFVGGTSDVVTWQPGGGDRFAMERTAVGGSTWTTVADGLTEPAADLSALPEGRLALRVRGTLAATGATALSPVATPVVIDRTAPLAPRIDFDRAGVLRDGTTWYPAGTSMHVEATDRLAPDTSAGSGVEPHDVLLDTHGPVGEVQVADRAGNVSPPTDPGAAVDAAAPVVEVLGCPADAVEQDAAVSVTVTASDLGSGLELDPSGTRPLSTDTPGPHELVVEARDHVGSSTTASCSWTVSSADGTDPPTTDPPPPPPGPAPPPPSGGGAPPAPAPTQEPTTEPTEEPEEPPTAPPTEPTSPDSVERVDDPSPLVAATSISRIRFTDASATRAAADGRPARHAVLVRDDAFADALAGASLSGEGPLLLTDGTTLSTETAEELRRVLPAGATVYLLGGIGALSAEVEDRVTELGYLPVRLAGATRVETSIAVADDLLRLGSSPARVMLARADGPADNPTAAWADAVSGGAHGARTGTPVLLTPSATPHPAVVDWLDDHGATPILLGGTAALSDAHDDLVGATRVEGPDRASTAIAVGERLWALASPFAAVTVIGGWDVDGWARGLAAAGLAADNDAPLVLVGDDVLPASTAAATRCATLFFVGGTDTISAGVEASMREACPTQ